MAKKAASDSPFITEKTDAGVQVKIYPFRGIDSTKHGSMFIIADVKRPKADRRAEVRMHFAGVIGDLSQTEAVAWISSMRGLLDEAVRVGATLKPPATRKAKAKSK